MDYLKKHQVLKHIIISTVVHLIGPALVIWIYPLFSHEHVLQPGQLSLKYDEILYFHNDYEYEPNHAFMFGYTYLVKLSKLLCNSIGNFWAMTLLLIINKLAYLSAAGDLYVILQNLAATTTNQNKDSKQENAIQRQNLSFYGLLFFIYNPAGIFFNSVYTEAVFSFLTFKAIKYLLTYQSFTNHAVFSKVNVINHFFKTYPLFLPTFLLLLGCCIKSNGILLSAVIGLELVSGLFTIKQLKKWVINALKGFTILILLLLPYLIHSYLTYHNLCLAPQIKGDLCSNNIFGIYGAVQQKYWGVGFLKHYTKQNILFIILGAPAIIIGGIGLFFYTKKFNLRQTGLYLSFLLIWITTTFFANVQPSTRFFCAHPFFYFILAKLGTKTFLVRFWAMAYWIIGIFLFTVRMPWV